MTLPCFFHDDNEFSRTFSDASPGSPGPGGREYQDFVFIDPLEISTNSRHLGYLGLKVPKLQVVVEVKVQQDLEILNRGNKMLKEFLRQAENKGMVPIKAKKGE